MCDFLKKSAEGALTVDEQVEFLERYTPDKVSAEDAKMFADFMTKQMTAKLKMPGCIDICGTGGSGLERINTSTIATFILAELGVGIAKHGNKAASGRFGSFDLLEAIGVDIEKGAKELEEIYRKKGLAFIYARNFHPVMRFFGEARKKIGKPTIFNILGPLLNPAGAEMQIIGTGFKDQMRLIAESCKLLGKKRVMVVRGRDGLDEVTLTEKTDVVELRDGEIFRYSIAPEDFGLKRCSFSKIAGGDREKNIRIATNILKGECKSRHADLVYVNCALALKLAGKVSDLKEGYKMAKATLGIGKLEGYKGNILDEIAASKVLKKSDRDFFGALKMEGLSVIAEIKKASPSEGNISTGKFDVRDIAKTYEDGGASAISVLTDEKYFKGSFENLRKAREATREIPLLCKDFIIHEYQIYKAREYGADAVLLIAALLTPAKIQKFLKIAESLGMDCLVEVHDEDELENVLKTEARIIGINNRDLKTFTIDLETTDRLVKKIPNEKIVVSESGISLKKDIEFLPNRVDAVLIGTGLMKEKNKLKKLHEIT